ncbi:sulfurtransferase complex subunit TusD [Vibrio variabilis]|uniref:sulfurtransferase complex subunit TusD n=1 Tax=Vibrio variabilis TaxID=990271 RepID=UPI001EFA094A|nr:sulfurtransferase complex subunit TusD [Vibrio variabilis]
MSALTYSLVVNGSVYGSQSARNAYQFANALIAKGHKLVSVFFYQDGVHNASRLTVPANDEFDLVAAWQNARDGAWGSSRNLRCCIIASWRVGE